MGRFLLFFMCLSAVWLNGQELVPARVVEEHLSFAKFEETNIFKTAQRSEVDLPKEVTEYNILSLDRQALKNLINKSDENISFSVPVNDRENLVLQLVETRMEGLIIRESNGNRQVKFNPGRHFQGIIKGNPNSLVAISFFENDVMGFISDDRTAGNLVIGKMEDNSGDFIIYRDDVLLSKIPLECGTEDIGPAYDPAEIFHNPADRALTDCVKLYFEVDYNIFTNKGGMTPTINYITGLYNQVKALYNNESINTTVSEIFVWSTASPYTGTSSSTMLNQFTAYRNGFNGNIAMLLSFSSSGGIAYVNTLCNSNPDYRMSFSSINTTYATVPTYSWSVEVVTHEFGHLLGSQHTHACAWNGNNTAIDGCYTPEGGCANPGLPSGGGTIMSYCHLTSVGINFNNGFGPQPGNLIRNKVTVASCLTACPGAPTPTCTDGIQNGQETGVDCGGPTCPPCSTGCTTNSGTLTLVLDNYPSETTWNIRNANNVILYSGGPYSIAGATITVPLCLPNACYTFNIFDSYGDGICCTYGNGSYNVVINGTNVASGGQFASAQTRSFCLNATTPSCTDGIKNGQETGVDCGGPTCPPCPPSCTDGIKNGQETGVDCGGPTCPPCAATCSDGIQNGQETGVDCGGPTCQPCPPTCSDGIQNGQETGVDCGGPVCQPCSSTGVTTLGAYYFETGWDSWIDGGDDAIRYSGTRSYEGSFSISLRDNSGVISSMTSPAYQASSFASLKVEFNFYAYSMDPNEDFWLQYSNNNGSTWTTVGTWVNGANFVNNTFYLATVTINNANYGFTNTSKFRFVCDASTNSDLIYIDAVKVKGLSTSNLEGNQLLAMSSGIETEEKEITVFPNPASDELTVQVREAGDSDMQVSLMDIMGKNYTTTILPAGQSIVKVDLGEIRQGIYILTVSNDGEIVHSERVVVIHP